MTLQHLDHDPNGSVMTQPLEHLSARSRPIRGLRTGKSWWCPARSSCRLVIDGVELHWTEQGSGPPLLLLHGLADSQHTWTAVTAELAKRYRVLALDLPGCGLSGRPDAPYGLDWQACLTDRWLQRLGIGEVDVIGHSYGGGMALWLLLYRARLVRKMGLIAPGGLGVEVSPLLRLAAVLGIESLAEILLGPCARLFLAWQGGGLGRAERELLHRMNCMPGTARALARTVKDVVDWRGQTRHVLHRIHQVERLPAIGLFWGDRDQVIPIEHGRALCSMLENCTLWELPGGDHFLHWQAPKALSEALLTFLGRDDLQPSVLRKGEYPPCRPEPRERPWRVGSAERHADCNHVHCKRRNGSSRVPSISAPSNHPAPHQCARSNAPDSARGCAHPGGG